MKLSLTLNNITIFERRKTISGNGRVILYKDLSATGKTSIARAIEMLFTGDAEHYDLLVSQGRDEGRVELTLDGRTYRAVIRRSGGSRADRVVPGDYGDYLVLADGNYLYALYAKPPKDFLEEGRKAAEVVVPEPRELGELRRRLQVEGSGFLPIDRVIEQAEQMRRERERVLEELRRKLGEVEGALAEALPREIIDTVIRRNTLRREVERLEKRVKELEEERARLALEVQEFDYEAYRDRERELRDGVARLETRMKLYRQALDALGTILRGLEALSRIHDVLVELNRPLFGQLVDGGAVRMWIEDVEGARDEISRALAEMEAEKAGMERELREVVEALDRYVDSVQRIEVAKSEAKRLSQELRDKRYELARLDREVAELLKKLGLTEEELMERIRRQADAGRLLDEKRRLEEEIARVERQIADIERQIETAVRRAEEHRRREREYKELRRRYKKLLDDLRKRRDRFLQVYREKFLEMITLPSGEVLVKDFDTENLRLLRHQPSYSESERFILAVATQYGIASAIKALGLQVPFIVIDFIVPIDQRYEKQIKRVLTEKSDLSALLMQVAEAPEEVGVYKLA